MRGKRRDQDILNRNLAAGVLAAAEQVDGRAGQTGIAVLPADDAGEMLVERNTAPHGRRARATASETERIAFAPSRDLFAVPSSSIRRLVQLGLICADTRLHERLVDLAVDIGDRVAHAESAVAGSGSPSRSSCASAVPVEAPEGTETVARVAVRQLAGRLNGRSTPRVEYLDRVQPGNPSRLQPFVLLDTRDELRRQFRDGQLGVAPSSH